jgi:hypothetical protein
VLPKITAQPNTLDFRMPELDIGYHRPSVIRTAIIHQDNLKVLGELGKALL